MTRARRGEGSAEGGHHHPLHTVSFGKSQCCYLTREVAVLLVLFMVSGVVATGLLVYYFAPHPASTPGGKLGGVSPSQEVEQLTSTDVDRSSKVSPHTTSPLSPLPPPPLTTVTGETMTQPGEETIRTAEDETEGDVRVSENKEEEMSEKEKKRRLRLPLTLKPLRYLVKLQPLINGNFSILGYVEVEVEVLEATSNFTLHMADIITKNNTIRLMESGVEAGQKQVIRRHEYDHEREFYIAHLEEPLQEGHTYVLSMEFMGLLNDKLKGFYRSTYRDANGTETRLAVTQFQATDARRAFPCLDEPGLKATFEVYLARQTNMTTISNMPIKETIPVVGQEGWVWDHYDTTVPMSTYLLAFVVSDFASMNSTVLDDILFRVWAREEALQQAHYSLDIGPRILAHFTHFFNLSYPLPKLDMIAIPDFAAGAMENWGLTTYREELMLYEAGVSAAANKQRVAAVVAHELAHQWFGNLVTPKWWTDIWLNEGFASYVEYLGVDHVEPSWHVLEQFVVRRVQSVFQVDSLQSSHPIRHDAENADRIAYDKGSSIIRMMSHFLGEATFRSGLSDYLSSLIYGNAESDDLWEYLTRAGHKDGTLSADQTVKTIMDTWTLQMGYPVITVERSNDGTSATVSQERFLLTRQENSEDTHDYKWWVPLTYTDGAKPDFSQTQPKVWMRDSEAQVTIPDLATKDHWLIFNLQQTGYYRVNYDLHNWRLLTSQLLSDHTVFATINRAQIIDDAMNLARADRLPYATALNILRYLPQEMDYVPWASAFDNLKYIKGMFASTAGYGPLKRYLVGLVLPLYKSVGFKEREGDPLLDQYKRQKALSWACHLDLPDCLHKAVAAWTAWTVTPDNNTISANLKSTVYCHAIAEGKEEEWTFAWHQYLRSNVATEKVKLLTALGCSRQIWVLARYLDMAFSESSGIRKQDVVRVFASVASNEVGRSLAWTFLQDNWDHIYSYSESIVMRLVQVVSQNFNTETQLKELESFQEAHKKQMSSSALDLAQVVENTRQNVAWTRRHNPAIMTWLDHRGHVTRLPSF